DRLGDAGEGAERALVGGELDHGGRVDAVLADHVLDGPAYLVRDERVDLRSEDRHGREGTRCPDGQSRRLGRRHAESITLWGILEAVQLIDPQGHLVGADPGLAPGIYQAMYRNMVLARELDRRMLALQRQGRIGTYAMLEGHEAVQIGSAMALRPDDFVFPSYREHGVQITHGLPIDVLLAYWRGLPNSGWDVEKYRTGIVTVPIAS